MTEDFIKTLLTLAVQSGLGLPVVLCLLAVGAVVLVVGRRINWPAPPPPSPDPQSHQSPPIPLRPDGSIPVSNPTIPPDPGPA